ncbi:hypothetical protein ABIA38_008504 [Embleya sp. AB8]
MHPYPFCVPRRNKPPSRSRSADRDEPRDPSLGFEERESGADGDWLVRPISGQAATKTYRCPGCDHEIPPGVPHLVAWSADGRVEERRHWHRPCWNSRGHRRITRRR